jgi:hypothetical protein
MCLDCALFCVVKGISSSSLLFFYWRGRPEPRLSYFSLRIHLYSNYSFIFPIQLQRRPTPPDVRNLCYRNEKLWARNGRSNLARHSNSHVIAGFFYMPQSCYIGQTLYFSSQGMHAEDFFPLKIRRLRPGLNTRSLVPEGSMLTATPPKPL